MSEMKSPAEAEKLQVEGTREFDEAIAGSGPKMPVHEQDPEEDAELTRALKDTFPASDPLASTSPATKVGKPQRGAGKQH
jgi:hypothetical protein